MKKIAFIAFVLGVLLAFVSYIAEVKSWTPLAVSVTIGFAGYVLVISAAAYYLTAILHEWSKDTEAWQG